MKKLGNKIEAIPIVRKLNSHRWMSLVWWSILVMILPYIFSICRVLFCLAMLPHFALYNLMFGLIYLIIEAFGLMNKNIYR